MKISFFTDFGTFFQKPESFLKHKPKVEWLKVFQSYALLSVGALIAGIIATTVISYFVPETENAIEGLFDGETSWIDIALFAVVIGPILEELAFRLLLRFSRVTLAFGIPLYLGLLGLFFGQSLTLDYAAFLVGISLVLLAGLYSWKGFTKYKSSYSKYYRVLLYTTVLTFGFAHLTNFSNPVDLILIAPLVNLPQLWAGAVFSYVRVKFGFIFTTAFHMIYNGVAITPVLMLYAFGIALDEDISAESLTEILSDSQIISLAGLTIGGSLFALAVLGINIYSIIEWVRNKKKTPQK